MKLEIKNKILFILAPKNEVLRNKSNKINIRSIWGKFLKPDEINVRSK